MRKKKNIHHLKTKSDNCYAMEVARQIIERNSLYTLVNYIIWSWEAKPKIKQMDLLNVITEEYLNKQKGKYEKTNIVKFNPKLN
jgi:hypothetical protein